MPTRRNFRTATAAAASLSAAPTPAVAARYRKLDEHSNSRS